MTQQDIDEMKDEASAMVMVWKAAVKAADDLRQRYLDKVLEINEAERQLLREQHEMFDQVEKGC